MVKIKIKKTVDTIVYSGSFIQTKINEPSQGSFISWEWYGDKYLPSIKKLGNIYSTITEDVENAALIVPADKNQLVVLKYDSAKMNKTEAAALKKEVQAKLGNKVEMKPLPKKKILIAAKADEIRERKKIDLNNAMNEYLKILGLSDIDIKKIIELDNLYTSNLDLSKDFELGDFTIKSMGITNFLAFKPEEQVINFDKDGVIGIGGPNRVGKSSIIKAIIFCLYNSSPDNNASLSKLINKHNRKEEASVWLMLQKNGEYYKIIRTLIPKKKEGVSIDLDFQLVDEYGVEIKSLKGEKRQETEKEIQKYFGIESAFEILSLYSAQKRQQELIDCKNSERLLLVNRFIGLQNYEIKGKEAGEELKVEKSVYQSVLKDFNQATDITSMEKELSGLHKKTLSTLESIDEINEDNEIFEFKNRYLISNYELNKKLASKTVENPDKAKDEIDQWESIIEERSEKRKEIEELIKKLIEQKESQAEQWKNLYNSDISKFRIDYKKMKPQQDELAVVLSDIKRLETQLTLDNCTSCGKKITIKSKELTKSKIEKLANTAMSLKVNIESYEFEIKSMEAWQDMYSNYKDDIESLEIDLKKIDSIIKNAKINIENLQLKTKDWDEVQEAKQRLEILEKDYQRYQSRKKDSMMTLRLLQSELGGTNTKIKLLQKEIDNYKTQYSKLQASEEKIRVLKLYKDVVGKDGLPLFILKSKIDDINEQVNLIISQVFDFEVQFSVDEDSGELNVEFFYEGDGEKNDVGFASGSETFIINLCIKVGLSQVSELPKLNSLIIDEGYGTLDAETIGKIPGLFSVLPEYYKNVITVSHIDELKDLYQYEIKLQKSGKYTEIIN